MAGYPLTEQARAAGALVDAMRPRYGESPQSERLKVAAGVALFGDSRLAALDVCSVCGVLGNVGDDCGRPPEGHTLTASGKPSYSKGEIQEQWPT